MGAMPLNTPGGSITRLNHSETYSLEWLRRTRPLMDSNHRPTVILEAYRRGESDRLTFEEQAEPTGAISTSRWITPGRTPLLNGWKKLPTLGSAQTLSPARSASTSPAALAIRSNGDTAVPTTSSSRWIKKSPSRWARSCAAWGTRRTNTRAKAEAGRNGGGDPQVPHVGGPHLRRAKPQQATAMRAKRLRSQLLFIKKI